jgi:hypothetical protein
MSENKEIDRHITTCVFCGQTVCDHTLDEKDAPYPAAYYWASLKGRAMCYKCMLAYQHIKRFKVWDYEITLYCHECGEKIVREGDKFVCSACGWGFSIDDDGNIH